MNDFKQISNSTSSLNGDKFRREQFCYSIAELLKIANGQLPRVRLEYDKLNEEINSTMAELNSWKVVLSNEVRVYQDFCDRNLALKRGEDEL